MNTIILKLTESKNKEQLSFRENKLTRILVPLLLGDASVTIIACLNPTTEMQEESLNTLQFALKSKEIIQKLKIYTGVGEISYLSKYKSKMSVLKEKLESISGINSLQNSISDQDEEEKITLENELENLQNAILISEAIRDGKMLTEEEQLWDFSDRLSIRLRYLRESSSTPRNSTLEEVEEEDSLPNPFVPPRISDVRMSIPEEPTVGQLSPFESKQHLEMFRYSEERSSSIGNEIMHKPGIPLPHPDWLKLILDQESLITKLQTQLSMKIQENTSLKAELKCCKEKLQPFKANLKS